MDRTGISISAFAPPTKPPISVVASPEVFT
ncbi:hypothetical protein D020_4308A, partial [Vibrio parahaemolyticus SBR10290]